jgi:hypothetical protein
MIKIHHLWTSALAGSEFWEKSKCEIYPIMFDLVRETSGSPKSSELRGRPSEPSVNFEGMDGAYRAAQRLLIAISSYRTLKVFRNL